MKKLLFFLAIIVITNELPTRHVSIGRGIFKPKMVFVVFRHGDRAPDPMELTRYLPPMDDNKFYPVGLGGLTNMGKQREYRLGQILRKNYNKLLGDEYVPNEIHARSTNYDRTKMCLQLLLSALYPYKGRQVWNKNLKWQPIPGSYVHDLDDTLLIPEECPNYLKERQRVEQRTEVQQKLESFKDFMADLSNKTGKLIKNSNNMYYLYHGLTAVKAMGRPIPEWAETALNGRLLDGINFEYEIFSYNVHMRRLNGGMLVRDAIEKMTAVINGTSPKKMVIYSGHETNVAAFLQALGVYVPHVPEYGSAVIIELLENNGKHYVKVKYARGKDGSKSTIPENLETQTIKDCNKNCPLDEFIYLMKPVLPSDKEMICNRRVYDPTVPPKPYEV